MPATTVGMVALPASRQVLIARTARIRTPPPFAGRLAVSGRKHPRPPYRRQLPSTPVGSRPRPSADRPVRHRLMATSGGPPPGPPGTATRRRSNAVVPPRPTGPGNLLSPRPQSDPVGPGRAPTSRTPIGPATAGRTTAVHRSTDRSRARLARRPGTRRTRNVPHTGRIRADGTRPTTSRMPTVHPSTGTSHRPAAVTCPRITNRWPVRPPALPGRLFRRAPAARAS
jgi:hypothetical protein